MKLHLDFASDKTPAQITKETLDYFLRQGFQLHNQEAHTLEFSRGSGFKNLYTYDPLQWKSVSRISMQDQRVLVDIEINTIHQSVSPAEKSIWQAFVANYQKSIETGVSFIEQTQEFKEKNRSSMSKTLRLGLTGALLFALPSGIFAFLTGIDSAVAIGTASGAMLYIMSKVQKRKVELP